MDGRIESGHDGVGTGHDVVGAGRERPHIQTEISRTSEPGR